MIRDLAILAGIGILGTAGGYVLLNGWQAW